MNAFANIFKIPELRRRLLLTLGFLAIYRLGIFVTTPGVDRNVMREIVQSQSGGFLGMFNMFSGGGLEQLSIFALGIMPYVTASIILQLLTVVIKPLDELRKEGEAGRRKINQYTRYGTIGISIMQSTGISFYLQSLTGQTGANVVHDPGPFFVFLTVVSLTTGTAFIMWLGEQITERGIGNGISLIIFAGIVANLPNAVVMTIKRVQRGELQPVTLVMVVLLCLLVVATIVFFERGQRRLPIHYAKRMVGTKMYGGQTSHLPLRINASGVIPPIFASSLMMFPNTLANFKIPGTDLKIPGMEALASWMVPGDWRHMVVYMSLIIFFCFFYTAITFQPVEVADNLKKQNAFVPGVRPGKQTADYIDRIMSRITVGGALYVAVVCAVPDLMRSWFHVPFYFGGTSIMIVVGVALDTVQQIESHLITRHYEGLTGPTGPRIRGRRAAA